jgi:carbon-monoxide dehydrogenase medium subunit
MLPEFELLRPEGLSEALDMLAGGAAPIAGGTNLLVDMRCGKHRAGRLVDVSRLGLLRYIRQDRHHIWIGGGTTITDLLRDPLISCYAPALRDAAAVFANSLIRNRATVGGNLVDASPAADTAPPLLALDAEVELQSRTSVRWVRLDEFFLGVRRTARRDDELLTAVRFPVPAARSASYFHKIGLRKADAISVLSAAVVVRWDGGERCTSARIALGAVAPQPLRARAAEEFLTGQILTPALAGAAARLAAEAIRPIDDIRGSTQYRREVTEVVVRRLLDRAAAAAKAGGEALA